MRWCALRYAVPCRSLARSGAVRCGAVRAQHGRRASACQRSGHPPHAHRTWLCMHRSAGRIHISGAGSWLTTFTSTALLFAWHGCTIEWSPARRGGPRPGLRRHACGSCTARSHTTPHRTCKRALVVCARGLCLLLRHTPHTRSTFSWVGCIPYHMYHTMCGASPRPATESLPERHAHHAGRHQTACAGS